MRPLLLCALFATAAFADTSSPPPSPPGTPRLLPRPDSAAWRSVRHAVAAHCKRTREPACACVLAALRARPPILSAEWQHDELVLTSDVFDAIIGATLAPRGEHDWRVVELQCTSLINPRF